MPDIPALRIALRRATRLVPTLAAVALALASVPMAGCSRPQPSEDYAEASRLFNEALAEHGDDAYDDPRAAEALELAKQVPPDSLDAEAARFLADRIRDGKKASAERRQALEAAREAAVEDAEEIADDGDEDGDDELFGAFGDDGEEDDAPPPTPGLLRPGSPASDFTRRYAGCYQVGRPFVETGGTREGLSYSLVDTEECRAKHPELRGMLVYISGDRVFNIAPASEAKPLDLVKDGDGYKPAPPAPPEPEEEVHEIVLERDDEPEIVEERVFVPGMPSE